MYHIATADNICPTQTHEHNKCTHCGEDHENCEIVFVLAPTTKNHLMWFPFCDLNCFLSVVEAEGTA
jgi:hypothetical protein